MKRFTFKGVLDNFRQSVSQPTKAEQSELVETLKADHCQLARTCRHGFPHQPTALAYDPIQRLVAIGTKSGAIRILGRPGVSVQVRHDPLVDSSFGGGGSGGGSGNGSERASSSAVASSGSSGTASGLPSQLPVGAGGSTSGNHHSGPGIGGSNIGGGSGNSSATGGASSTGAAATGATGGGGGSASSSHQCSAAYLTNNQASATGGSLSSSGSGSGPAVLQLQFLVNEGALVSATSDDSLHLWNIRQKRPEIVHSLKFQRERITCFHLPFQSKWLYVGTERGNVHVVNVESFTISGYVINWNKAIELSCKTHPGPVIHLSDCPTDPSKLLMGFESGLLALWDLRTKTTEARFVSTEPLRSASWLSDGKQLVSAHTDGSLCTWNTRAGPRPAPVLVSFPHAKGVKPECKAIQKVEWRSSQSGDPYVIFSGGLPQDRPGRSASITVVHGRSITVLEMEHNVVDFVTLCDTPWASETQDPHAIIVLLQNDLVIVDLLTPGFPCFENPYPMDIHESAVTCCLYVADCPGDLIPALYSVGAQGHSGFSKRDWPINGGEWGSIAPSYAELIVTGHADGTVKFWDTSSLTLQVLYRLKTGKVFDKSRSVKTHRPESSEASSSSSAAAAVAASSEPSQQHLGVKRLAMCPENRLLAVAGASGHVVLFKFRRQEASSETTILDVPLFFEITEDPQGSPSFAQVGASLEFCTRKEQPNPLSVRTGSYRRTPGFQADLVCLSTWMDGEAPGAVTALSVNSAYGLMAYGNDSGLVLIDVIQKSVLLSMASADLYSSADPYTRLPRSPKRPTGDASQAAVTGSGISRTEQASDDQSCRSPSYDPQSEILLQHLEPCGADTVDDAPLSTAGIGEESVGTSVLTAEASVEGAIIAAEEMSCPHPMDEEVRSNEHRQMSASGKIKKKNFSLKKQLSKVDSKMRDLLVSASRRGSAASGGASTSAVDRVAAASSAGSSPQLPVSPQEEQPPTSFPFPGDESSTESHQYPVDEDPMRALVVEDDETAVSTATAPPPPSPSPVPPPRPPRRLKKAQSVQQPSTSSKPAVCASGRVDHSSWKRTWNSNDESCSNSSATAILPHVLDLRLDASDEPGHTGFIDSFVRKFHKTDSAFTRSRSSSTSSLETPANEAVTILTFADTLARKLDTAVSASLWVGTSQGSVLVIVINLAAPGEPRLTQPVMISPSGSIFRVKGSLLCLAFMEPSGSPIANPTEPWRDESKESKELRSRTPTRSSITPGVLPGSSGSVVVGNGGDAPSDHQYAVMVSEKQARVVSLPSQTCLYRVNLAPAESAFVVTANVVNLKDGPALASFSSNGHIQIFSLPSLRPLMDVEFTPLVDLNFQTSRQNLVDPMLNIWAHQASTVNEDSDKIARNFRFSAHGHGMYLCSPSEIEKFTVSSEFVSTLNDLMGELFLPCDMPEPPKEGFFKGLFGGGVRPVDRDELFAESATGKPARGVARMIPGPAANLEHLNYRAGSVAAEVQKTRLALNERGDKLGQLEDRTQRMANEAENFSTAAHQLMAKYRDKKWYQL